MKMKHPNNENFREYIKKSYKTYLAIAAGYAVGALIATNLPDIKLDHSSLLEKLRKSQGENSTLVKFLEGHVEPGWSPVDMIMYIQRDEEK